MENKNKIMITDNTYQIGCWSNAKIGDYWGNIGDPESYGPPPVLSVSINPENAPGEVQVTTVWLYTVGP